MNNKSLDQAKLRAHKLSFKRKKRPNKAGSIKGVNEVRLNDHYFYPQNSFAIPLKERYTTLAEARS